MNKLKKGRMEKGITLIALIITIIVLLILAIVTIGAIKNEGIIQYAQNARTDYTDAANKEQEALNTLFNKIEENAPGNNGEGAGKGEENTLITVAQAQEKGVLSTIENTDVVDEYGNIVKVPAGFKITEDASNVTQGIVIEDCTEAATKGSQFVWVPVGKVYTDTAKTEEKAKTITLGRYGYDYTTGREAFKKNENGEYVPIQKAEDYATQVNIKSYGGDYDITEDIVENHTFGNAIAKDIGAFCNNTIKNGGYYIGRYEAGKENNTLVCKVDKTVYVNVTQPQAASLSQDMYKNATTFTSDLINSYAWDTAIIFIQTFGGCEDYYYKSFSTSFEYTGVNNDKYCNIHDMSGNAFEWSTETCSRASWPCVYRSGCFSTYEGVTLCYTSYRSSNSTTNSYSNGESFRPLLYL